MVSVINELEQLRSVASEHETMTTSLKNKLELAVRDALHWEQQATSSDQQVRFLLMCMCRLEHSAE